MEEGRAMKKKVLWVILGLFLCFAPAGSGWSANLLGDADFETTTGKWTEFCGLTGSSIATQDPLFAHSPNRFAWMGGYDDAVDYIYQDVTIPADAKSAYLQFWYSISTWEEAGAWDLMVVDVRSPNDA